MKSEFMSWLIWRKTFVEPIHFIFSENILEFQKEGI